MKNYSKQREDILLAAKSLRNHPTAEEIYEKVKESNSTASKSTVYRNLKELVSEKIIWKISVSDGPDKYDFPLKKHNHIICSKCGKIKDFEYNFNNNELKNYIQNQTSINFDGETVVMYGVCDECNKN